MAVVVAVAVGIWQYYPKSPEEDSPSVEKATSPLAEQQSIAVLPFDNISNDPEQEYFCDGIADQIINSIGAEEPSRILLSLNGWPKKRLR